MRWPGGAKVKVAVIGGGAWFVGTLRSVLDGGGFALCSAAEDVAAFLRAAGGNGKAEAQEAAIAILAEGPVEPAMARLLPWVRAKRPSLRVIVRLPALRAALVRDAMQGGAWGCITEDDPPEALLAVLNSVAQGRVSFPYVDFAALRQDPFEQLTRRELEVLKALAQGWSNTRISARLGISENTVKYHLKLIYDKLGVPNRATAVAQFLQRAEG
jgi:two-component system nitrate/nitrite response regulator NarP